MMNSEQSLSKSVINWYIPTYGNFINKIKKQIMT